MCETISCLICTVAHIQGLLPEIKALHRAVQVHMGSRYLRQLAQVAQRSINLVLMPLSGFLGRLTYSLEIVDRTHFTDSSWLLLQLTGPCKPGILDDILDLDDALPSRKCLIPYLLTVHGRWLGLGCLRWLRLH